jgi:hypothetical protein
MFDHFLRMSTKCLEAANFEVSFDLRYAISLSLKPNHFVFPSFFLFLITRKTSTKIKQSNNHTDTTGFFKHSLALTAMHVVVKRKTGLQSDTKKTK